MTRCTLIIGGLVLQASALLAQLPQEMEPLPNADIPPPVELTVNYPWWVYLSGGVLVAAIVVLIVWLLMGGKAPSAIPVKRPIQTALRLLKALRAKADQMAPAEIGHEVSEILRRFYQDRYHIPAPYRTTQELFPSVRLEDEPLRRRHWRERYESLAALYDSLSYAPLPASPSEAIALIETAITKLEEERLNENPLVP